MQELRAATTTELQAAFDQALAMRCAIAFAAGCRLAVTTISEQPTSMQWTFVVLSPGEKPPEGYKWTIYEQRPDGLLIGRSA